MREVSGDFEIHITAHAHEAERLAAFAAEHGAKFVHIVLDRGRHASQPMLTLSGRGPLAEQRATVDRWNRRLRDAGFFPRRSKIEAAPWCAGVPRTDEEAAAEPPGRYVEHHITLLLPDPTVPDLVALIELVGPHGARLSRSARRERPDGGQERFVNQRCHGVGLATATRRLDGLVQALRGAGHRVTKVEQEYVVHDSDLGLDHGWLDRPASGHQLDFEDGKRSAPAGAEDYPPTYQPLPGAAVLRQRAAFDPALKQYRNAYRAGEPTFAGPTTGRRWFDARRTAMNRVLAAVAATRWGDHLVLRGSVTMPAWVGAAAREPGDLDFVVTPPTITSDSADARRLLDDVKAAIGGVADAGLRPHRITESAIWTYERADGRRLAVPFQASGVPDGHVQLDVVFGERLPVPPERLALPGVARPVLAASAPLSLAWKLLWLATDVHPQGKDLYDAVLLAEHTTVDRSLVRDLLRPALGDQADAFTAGTVLSWQVDWTNFTDEYPGVSGPVDQWIGRLALALDRAWT